MTGVRRPVGLVVAAAFVAAAAVGLPGTPAQAKTVPKHVAVVVDFGAEGGASAHCSPPGTGYSVLADGYRVEPNKTGLIVKINGIGSDSPPLDLYWSYWHLGTHGRWNYAGDNPNTNSITPGSVDGWVYGDGKTPPPPASYASICAGRDPTVAPTHQPAPKPTHSSAHRTTHPASAPTATGSSTVATSTSRTRKTRSATKQPHSSSPAPTRAGAASSDSIVLANALPTAPPKAKAGKQSGIPPWGTALAIVLVALLAGGAFWRTRARRQQSP